MKPEAVKVKPWELKAGDRILGTQLIVIDGPHYYETDLGGDRERQRYAYNLEGGKTIAYAGDSPGPTVLRVKQSDRP